MLTGEADVVAEDAAGDGGDEAGEDDDAGDLAGVRLVPRGVVKSNSHCSKTRSGNKRSKLPAKQDLDGVHVAYPALPNWRDTQAAHEPFGCSDGRRNPGGGEAAAPAAHEPRSPQRRME